MRKTVLFAGLLVAGFVAFASTGTVKAEESAQPQTNTAQPIVVEVQKNDNLSKIAERHHTTYVRIFNANESIKDPDVIYPGEKLRIPEDKEALTSREIQQNIPSNFEKPKTKVKSSKAYKKKTVTKVSESKPKASTEAHQNVAGEGVWDSLAKCESGGNWAINTGNGYYGGLQFTASTWKSVGGSGLPHQASREEQINRAQILQARSGWGQWPACTKKLGLR